MSYKRHEKCKPPKISGKSTDYQQLLKQYLSIQENWKVESLNTCICTCTVHTHAHPLTHTTCALELLRRKDLFGTLMFYARSLPFLLRPCPPHVFPTPISFDTNALLKILKSKLRAQNSCNSRCKSTCVLFSFLFLFQVFYRTFWALMFSLSTQWKQSPLSGSRVYSISY